jgi:transposase
VVRDWRDERIAELEAELTARDKRIALLERRIAQLGALLGRNSSNSSQPPSQDSPEQRHNRPRKKKTGRKRGAQPGHRGHQRELLPPEKVTKIEDCYPQECELCHATLPAAVDATPLRHQVVDIPPLEPSVTEFRLYAAECEECGYLNRARLPEGVPRSMFGPRLLALVGLPLWWPRRPDLRTRLGTPCATQCGMAAGIRTAYESDSTSLWRACSQRRCVHRS